MNNYIYIADNPNDDMFVLPPSFDTGAELPPPPVSEPSEMDTFMTKSFTSFGVMAICIVAILLVAFIVKKRKANETIYDNYELNTNEEQKEEQNIEPQPIQTRKRKASKLRTPNTLNKCIKAFLENTKEN